MVSSPSDFAVPHSVLHYRGRAIVVSQTRPVWAVLDQDTAEALASCRAELGLDTAERAAAWTKRIPARLLKLADVGLIAPSADVAEGHVLDVPPVSTYHVDHLFVEVHATCNLRCSFCYANAGPDRSSERLTPELVVETFRDFRTMGGQYVTVSGGEPLLYEPLEKVLRGAKACGLDSVVFTNGTCMSESHLSMLSELGCQLIISLDGSTAQTHDALRGRNSYRAAVGNLLRALERLGPQHVLISFTPVRTNVSELPALLDFAEEVGLLRVNVSVFEPVGRGATDPSLGLTNPQRVEFIRSAYMGAIDHFGKLEIGFNNTRNILGKFGAVNRELSAGVEEVLRSCERCSACGRLVIHNALPSGAKAERIREELFTPCSDCGELTATEETTMWLYGLQPMSRSARITPDGGVFPSALGSASPFRLGNIHEESISAILRKPALEKLYATAGERMRCIPACSTCIWRQICRGGDVTAAYYATGDLLGADPYCHAYLEVFPDVTLRLASLGREVS